MEWLGFSKRQAKKDEYMTTRATSASTGPGNPPKRRKPASIEDKRFQKERTQRTTCCDECRKFKSGNVAGAFNHRKNMPQAGERKAAWERGDWNATWYCTGCYMQYYNLSYADVSIMLGFHDRATKKARFVR
jgi:hypothetical protein